MGKDGVSLASANFTLALEAPLRAAGVNPAPEVVEHAVLKAVKVKYPSKTALIPGLGKAVNIGET